ncbi:LOW QUALITY PROTEIN: Hypothetical protein PHPALM_2271 [Phytophthora palmivora]|uniref:Reverse transcriptase n=1 Tax=Phytophthora palmivora TaxID=4796 RepID=A0A2P4YQ61_9STRA|nr:LOW QUALITY PROTEIN: Hypothetical protein PHPALM_2271 [Phytophthora palmivora]
MITGSDSPAKNLTLTEGKARAQAAKAPDHGSGDTIGPAIYDIDDFRSPIIVGGIRDLRIDRIRQAQDEEAWISGLKKYLNGDLQDLTQQETSAPVPPTPVYPRGYYPPDAGSGSPMFLEHLKAPRGLNHGRTSRGAYERALVQVEPLFVNDIDAARCVLLAPHRIPLKEFTSVQRYVGECVDCKTGKSKPRIQEHRYPDPGRRPVLKMVQELKELREDRLLSYVLDQLDLRIEFSHLIAKRQLHSVTEGLRQQSKSSAQDERGDRTP